MKKMCFYFFANAREKLLSQRSNGTFGFANALSQRKNQKSHFSANSKEKENYFKSIE